MKLEKYFVTEDVSILEVMRRIDLNASGIMFVLKNERLVAAISDGDIRRSILKNIDTSQPISTISNYKPLFLEKAEERNAIEYMQEKRIIAVPIVDKNMFVVDVKFLVREIDEQKRSLNVPVVIMAGGKGARLKPYTDILPKPLIPIGDVTITEHIMNRFSEYDCDNVTMIINYKKNFIKAYYMDKEIKQSLNFLEETDFLGTGGGIRMLEGSMDSPFFLTNCDILVDADYSKIYEYHMKNQSVITMVCAKKQITVPYGTVEVDELGNVISMQEKPTFTFNTNTGFYVISPEFMKKIPVDTFIHITDVIQTCIEEKDNVGVYLIEDDQWMDMGQLEELEKMKEKMGLTQ